MTISGIGKCKGSGRIQFFHCFGAMTIDSTFRKGDEVVQRQMAYAEPQKQIESDDFAESPGDTAAIGTTIKLDGFKETARARFGPNVVLSTQFSAPTLKKQMLLAFLQRLVGLASRLGDFEISFSTRHWAGGEQTEVLRRPDLPEVTTERVVEVEERDPITVEGLGTFQSFKLSHYQLDAASFGLPRNAIAFCAKSSPVRDVTRRKDERIIHSIFFPMRKDSTEVSDHDIWLLSEDYHYYDYIASDMPLGAIDGHEAGPLIFRGGWRPRRRPFAYDLTGAY